MSWKCNPEFRVGKNESAHHNRQTKDGCQNQIPNLYRSKSCLFLDWKNLSQPFANHLQDLCCKGRCKFRSFCCPTTKWRGYLHHFFEFAKPNCFGRAASANEIIAPQRMEAPKEVFIFVAWIYPNNTERNNWEVTLSSLFRRNWRQCL